MGKSNAGSSKGSRLIGDLPKKQGHKTMWYVYGLTSLKTGRLYVGITSNINRRLEEHNSGIGGKYTKKQRPFKLVHYEAFVSKTDAQKQEKFYKTGYGREVLNGKIVHSLKAIQ